MKRAMAPQAMAAAPGFRFGLRPFPGQVRLVDALGNLASRVTDGRVVISPWAGVRFEVDLRDRIQRQMWGGCYEPHVSRCFAALLRAGDAFVDIGAHIGYHAAHAAVLVGDTGKVFAFEPDPILHERACRDAFHYIATWRRTGIWPRRSSNFKAGVLGLTLCLPPRQFYRLRQWYAARGLRQLRRVVGEPVPAASVLEQRIDA